MSKSVYSIVLNDEVVDMVDKMARVNGVSRSLMIEKLLATAVGYETPESRINDILTEIERLVTVGSDMRYLSQPSGYMASIMSALSYRYNPAVKYSVEIFKNSDYLGRLKVALRTQNPVLINMVSDFYTYYCYLEKTYYNENARTIFDGMKMTRLFNFPKVNVGSESLAAVLTKYVQDFDELMNLYFLNVQKNADMALKKVEQKFIELKKGAIVI